MNTKLMGTAVVLFVGALTLAWFSNGQGVIVNDPERNIYIPEALLMPLQVKAAYNSDRIYFRYRWPAENPGIYHDMLRYESGKWVRYGSSTVGPQPQGIYEDRITMLVDDGSVPQFEKYGGYITVGDGMRFFTDAASKQDVKNHPYLGKQKHKKDVRKHLPETRSDFSDWASVVDKVTLDGQRKAGYFLDLWHWRAHRSNPVGKADDQFVAEYRYGDAGKGPYFNNWDKRSVQPRLMFDMARTGFRALSWNDIVQHKLGFDDIYYLREDQAIPFDSTHAWQEGDTLPRRVLRAGEGSRADISVYGEARWADGYWDVTLVRAMDTAHPLDDKIFQDNRVYAVAFSVHRNATGSRWHYISLPFRMGLNRDADFRAVRFEGENPPWQHDWFEVTLFYPGQVSWPLLNSRRHAGAEQIRQGVPVGYRHSEAQLAAYGVELEFNDVIVRQWWYTLFAGLLLIVAFGFAVNQLLQGRR